MPRIVGKPNINAEDYWDEVYRQEIRRGEVRYYPDRFDEVIALAGRNDGLMLDFAGGTGEFGRRFAELRPHWTVHVFERSGVASGYGREHYPQIKFLGFYPISYRYHFVHCGQTLEHVDYPDAFLAYLWDLVIPGGQLVVTVPNEDAIQDAEHVYRFDWAELRNMLPGDIRKTARPMQDSRFLIGWAIK